MGLQWLKIDHIILGPIINLNSKQDFEVNNFLSTEFLSDTFLQPTHPPKSFRCKDCKTSSWCKKNTNFWTIPKMIWQVMKTSERWRALPRRALFVSILAQKSSKDVKTPCRVMPSYHDVTWRLYVKWFSRESAHRQTDRHTHTQMGPILYPQPLTREEIDGQKDSNVFPKLAWTHDVSHVLWGFVTYEGDVKLEEQLFQPSSYFGITISLCVKSKLLGNLE